MAGRSPLRSCLQRAQGRELALARQGQCPEDGGQIRSRGALMTSETAVRFHRTAFIHSTHSSSLFEWTNCSHVHNFTVQQGICFEQTQRRGIFRTMPPVMLARRTTIPPAVARMSNCNSDLFPPWLLLCRRCADIEWMHRVRQGCSGGSLGGFDNDGLPRSLCCITFRRVDCLRGEDTECGVADSRRQRASGPD